MSVEWHKLGEYIEQCDDRNADERFGIGSVRGISIAKKVIDTKADMSGVSLTPYKLFRPNEFCFVTITSRNGGKISLACNESEETFIVSSSYEVFRVTSSKLLPGYLNLLFHRSEFDRYARFNSWGSAREAFSFADMQRVEIPVPPLAEQKKAVEAWQGLRKMKEQNEQLAEPLLALCRSYLQECKRKYEMVELGGYIDQSDERNGDDGFGVEDVRGISNEKEVIPTKADMEGVALKPYKLFRPDDFCYVTVTSRNGGKVSLSCNESEATYIVSSSYQVFRVKKSGLLPGYLSLLFRRSEFDRYARFNSWGSARETFNWADMCRVKIPLPPLDVQQAIVDVYRCANEAKKIAAEADRLSREICPALIRAAGGAAASNTLTGAGDRPGGAGRRSTLAGAGRGATRVREGAS